MTKTRRRQIPKTRRRTRSGPHGGKREGSGRKAAFGRKVLTTHYPMDLTLTGRTHLDRIHDETGLSYNDLIAAYLKAVTIEGVSSHEAFGVKGVMFPGKSGLSLAIRLPAALGTRLEAIQARTGKSYSDIGEGLIVHFSDQVVFPAAPAKAS